MKVGVVSQVLSVVSRVLSVLSQDLSVSYFRGDSIYF